MSAYTVTNAGRENGQSFSVYLFDVARNGCKLAELGHDYRGDEHWMRLPGGRWIGLPERIIEGGGPEPLTLTAAGIRAVDGLLA